MNDSIISKIKPKVQRDFLPLIPKQLHQRFLFGIQAFSFKRFVSINSNSRSTATKRCTGEMRGYRTTRDKRLLKFFTNIAVNYINKSTNDIIRLSLDFTSVNSLQMAQLAVTTGKGRALPIWLKAYTLKPHKNTMIPTLIDGLKSFFDIVDDKSRIVLAMDRWFCSPKLLRFLDEIGVRFVVRVVSTRKVAVPWDEDLVPLKDISHEETQCEYADLRLRLIVSKWEPNMKQEEPWFLLTNDKTLTRQQILNIYKKRFEIEEYFKDLKWLQGYEWQNIKTIEVIEVIMWFVTLGWWVKVELMHKLILESRSRQINPKKRLSFMRVILEELDRVFWPPGLLFVPL